MADKIPSFHELWENTPVTSQQPATPTFHELWESTPAASEATTGFWSGLGNVAKQGYSGAVEGMAGLGDMGTQMTESLFRNIAPGIDKDIPYNEPALTKLSENITFDPNPHDAVSRYSRKIGNYAGPGGVIGKAIKAPLAATALVDTAAGIGDQFATDMFPDSKVAPMVGGLVGGVTPSLLKGGIGAVKQSFVKASPKQIKATAGDYLKNTAKLSVDDIDNAILASSDDPFLKYKTTAELTDNPVVAQLEKDLTKTGDGVIELTSKKTLRNEARDGLLDSMTDTAAVNKELLAENLRTKAAKTSGVLKTNADMLWNEVPKNTYIPVKEAQAKVNSLIQETRGRGTRGVHGSLKKIISDFNAGNVQKSGELQNMRSEALAISRKLAQSPDLARDKAIADALAAEIDNAMKANLDDISSGIWQGARDLTRTEREIFNRSTSGGKLLDDNILDQNLLSKVFRGDKKSVNQLKAAINNDPRLIEDVKRGVLDLIKRDRSDTLTTFQFKKFLNSSEAGIKELFGKDHYKNMNKILLDLQSEDKVSRLAFSASKGNSITAQSQTIANFINRNISNKLPTGGIVADLINTLTSRASSKNAEAVKSLLLEASLDPKIAKEMLLSPTPARLKSLTQRFKDVLKQGGADTAKYSVLSQSLEDVTNEYKATPNKYNNTYTQNSASAPQSDQEKARYKQTEITNKSKKNIPQSYQNFDTNQRPIESMPKSAPDAESQLKGVEAYRAYRMKKQGLNYNTTKQNEMMLEPEVKAKPRSVDSLIAAQPPAVRAMIHIESSGKPNAKSRVGASGLMQLMPATAKELGVTDINDPEQNIKAGTEYLSKMLNKFKDTRLAVAAYNWGPGNLDKLIRQKGTRNYTKLAQYMPQETRSHVAKFLNRLKEENQA